MNNMPDIEVVFEFNGSRKNFIHDGYRPVHLIKDDYLTSGEHHYYDNDIIPSCGSAKGTITFITPEAYPQSLWIGKKISIQEGDHVVGYAIVTEIYNSILKK